MVGYSSWGHKESDATERLTHAHTLTVGALGIQAGSPAEEFDTEEVRLLVKPHVLMSAEKKNIMGEL